MKKHVIVVTVVLAVFMLGMLAGSCWAANKAAEKSANAPAKAPAVKPPKDKELKGTVAEVKDKDGNVTGVELTMGKGLTYQVTLDEKGKELGKTMSGKKVKVTGTIEMKDKAKWLTVKNYTEVVEKPKHEAKAKPEAKPEPKPEPKPEQKPEQQQPEQAPSQQK
jgi:hypothetical protein